MARSVPRAGGRQRRALLLLSVVALIAVLLLPLPALAAGTLDQQQPNQNGANFSGANAALAQTFTAGITGDLDQVDLVLFRQFGEPPPLGTVTVEIRSTQGGVPTSQVLGAARPVSNADLPIFFIAAPFAFQSYPLTAPVPVVAGTQYAIVTRGTVTYVQALGGGAANGGDLYPRGAAFRSDNNGPFLPFGQIYGPQLADIDFTFRTFVTPAATPAPPPVGGGTSGVLATTVTPVPSPEVKRNDDDDDDRKPTETQRRQKERTNAAGLDEYRTEGNVVGVRCSGGDPVPGVIAGPVSFDPNDVPYALIATRDGLQQVQLRHGTEKACGSIAVGDYLEADGQKDHEFRFIAEDVSIKRVRR